MLGERASGGRPRAGHPVRGPLTVLRLSSGAYWWEIHINTYLLCFQPLDTERLPAWHRQHCMGLLSRHGEDGVSMRAWCLCADLLSVLLLHGWPKGDNAKFEKARFLVLLVLLIAAVWTTSGLRTSQSAASSHKPANNRLEVTTFLDGKSIIKTIKTSSCTFSYSFFYFFLLLVILLLFLPLVSYDGSCAESVLQRSVLVQRRLKIKEASELLPKHFVSGLIHFVCICVNKMPLWGLQCNIV